MATEYTYASRLTCQKQNYLIDKGNLVFVQTVFPNYTAILPMDFLINTVGYEVIDSPLEPG